MQSQLQLGEIRRLAESGEDNADTQQEDKYQTCIKSIKQMTEEHFVQEDMEEGKG